jgi:hypothetical protein
LEKSILVLLLVSFITGCGQNVAFKDATSVAMSDGKVFESTIAPAETTSLPLDLIWVIDNSGSMNEEALHVRENFQKFATRISSRSDAKLLLISRKGTTGTQVALPSTLAVPSLQIDQSISSNNALSVLLSDIPAQLHSFLRPSAKKAIVVVSDDNSAVSASEFLSQFASLSQVDDMTLYGFIGIGASSPCKAREGTVYEALAQQTGGRVYNICDQDWSARFDDLADNVVSLTQQISIPPSVLSATILSVEINGHPLSKEDYTISPSGFVLGNKYSNSTTALKLRIVYSE